MRSVHAASVQVGCVRAGSVQAESVRPYVQAESVRPWNTAWTSFLPSQAEFHEHVHHCDPGIVL